MEAIMASFNIVSQDLNINAHNKDESPHVNRICVQIMHIAITKQVDKQFERQSF
jgi:hypothetical protein